VEPDTVARLQSAVALSPKLVALQAQLQQQHAALWSSMLMRDSGSTAEPVARPDPGDRRFAGVEWQASGHFDYLRQAYLINARFLRDYVEALELDPRTKGRLRFAARQLIDAMSPAISPPPIRKCSARAGDRRQEPDARVDEPVAGCAQGPHLDHRRVGVRSRPQSRHDRGAVVFENELFQLIQYRPLTAAVRKRPLLIFPPCINNITCSTCSRRTRSSAMPSSRATPCSWCHGAISSPNRPLHLDDYLSLGVIRRSSGAELTASTSRT